MENAGREAEACARAAEYYAGRGGAGCGVLRGARKSFLGRMLCACRGVLRGAFCVGFNFRHSFDNYLVFGPVSL